ncbi:hypothetical protein K2X89_03105, partial [Myxococcota bacterium]|nr:hypothetical protein [Myxococcota bacterium]
MSRPRRSALPDNLDPLVDTLSNVVGILVIVIALTQLELGDAVERVGRAIAEGGAAPRVEDVPAPETPPPAPELAARRESLRARGIDDLESARASLERMLAALGPEAVRGSVSGSTSVGAERAERDRAALEARVAGARDALALEKAGAERR